MTRTRTAHHFDHNLYQRDWGAFAQSERIDATIALGKSLPQDEVNTVADLSAAGTRITPEIADHYGANAILGDYGEVYGYQPQYTGPFEKTLPAMGYVDLYVLSETLEHLEDPDEALRMIRPYCKYILVTTPIWEEPEQPSHGHLWTWRREDVEEMLEQAHFNPIQFLELSLWGMWVCE